MKCISSIFLTIILLISVNLKSQNLQINEVVSKNYNGIESFEGKTEDWIEIYNISNDTIQLQNYFLSDDENNLQLWQFPNIEILPDSFLIVFASNENIFSPELHSNFKLSSKGEKLFLSTTTIIDSISIPALKADFSFGRKNEQSTEWNILDIPSPNFSNSESNQLSFSHESSFYLDDFYLKINALRPNHTIYYTLNGNEPDTNSIVFKDSLYIEDRSFLPNNISEIRTSPEEDIYHHNWQKPEFNISKINTIKFKSFRNNVASSAVYTLNFLAHHKQSNLKTICISIDSSALFDYDTGIYVPGKWFNPDYENYTGNYFLNKKVKAHFCLFDSQNKTAYSQESELRIKGNTTRASAQKSLKFFAKKKYGVAFFETEIITNDFTKYNTFILRNTQGSSLNNLISDDFANLLVSDLDIDFSKTEFCQVYLNGEYWGIQSLRNELNDDFLKEKYDLYGKEINIIDIKYNKIQGSNQSFLALINFIENNNLATEAAYKKVESELDITSYIDYQIAEMFMNNFDWPGNNAQLWKTNEPGSKWRFLFYDLDGTFDKKNKNMFAYCTAVGSQDWQNADEHTFLFRNLLKNNNFKKQFINRYIELLENEFSRENTLEKLNEIISEVNPNITKNIERWNYPESKSSWLSNMEYRLIDFLIERPCIVETQLNDFFDVKTERNSCNESKEKKSLRFSLFPNPNAGSFDIRLHSKNFTSFVKIKIYDPNGVQVFENELRLEETNTFQVKNLALAAGIYYVKISNRENFFGFQKIIISN